MCFFYLWDLDSGLAYLSEGTGLRPCPNMDKIIHSYQFTNKCLIDQVVRFRIFNTQQLNCFFCRLPKLELPIIFTSLKYLEFLVNTKCRLFFLCIRSWLRNGYVWQCEILHFKRKTSDFSKIGTVEFTDFIEFVEKFCNKDCYIRTCYLLCKKPV